MNINYNSKTIQGVLNSINIYDLTQDSEPYLNIVNRGKRNFRIGVYLSLFFSIMTMASALFVIGSQGIIILFAFASILSLFFSWLCSGSFYVKVEHEDYIVSRINNESPNFYDNVSHVLIKDMEIFKSNLIKLPDSTIEDNATIKEGLKIISKFSNNNSSPVAIVQKYIVNMIADNKNDIPFFIRIKEINKQIEEEYLNKG